MAEQDVLSEASDIKNGNLSNHFLHVFFFVLSCDYKLKKRKEKLLFSCTVLHPF
jgi:hypothetical protein